MQKIAGMSNGRIEIAAGTLYGAIKELLKKQWIAALPAGKDARTKEYVITDLGKDVVSGEIIRLEELMKNGKSITETCK